jgi:hypothetical protein
MLPALGMASLDNWSGDSPLLDGILGEKLSLWLGFLLWLVTGIGFVLAGLAVLGWLVPITSFRALALGSAVLSLVTLFLYPNGLPTRFNRIAAIIVNIFTIAVSYGLTPLGTDIVGM